MKTQIFLYCDGFCCICTVTFSLITHTHVHTCIWASESLREMLWELMVDPERGLFSCLSTSGPALTECLRGGTCWSTSCWGLCRGLCSSTGALLSAPLPPPPPAAAAARPCSFMNRLTWLCCCCWCCCCFLRLYSIMNLLMVLSVAMVYSLLPALSHHSFLLPSPALLEAAPTELPVMLESRLSPPVLKWGGRLPVKLQQTEQLTVWDMLFRLFSDWQAAAIIRTICIETQTWTLDWVWTGLPGTLHSGPSPDSCTRLPLRASPSLRVHLLKSGWKSQIGREAGRRRDLLLPL